jgi:hypothetical protein
MEKIDYAYLANYSINLAFHYSLLFLWSVGKGMQHIIDGNPVIVFKKKNPFDIIH